MHLIELNADRWRTPEHFYQALLPKLEAPSWHGHNLDALDDSIFAGGINRIEAPLHIRIVRSGDISVRMQDFLRQVQRMFVDRRDEAEATISFEPPL